MSDRIDRLRQLLREESLDALLVTNAHNRRYLSGFAGSAGSLLISDAGAGLATDFRYWEQAESQAPDFALCKQEGSLAEWLPRLLELGGGDGLGGKKLGFEAADLSVGRHKQFRRVISEMPPQRRPGLVQTEGLVERLRSVKDPAESAALERAVRLADQAFQDLVSRLEPGWTETQLAWEMERYAREHGAEAMSFPTIVGAGPWGAMPHCHPRDVAIDAGQPIVIDMGVVVDGYCSDMTRTIVLGQPDGRFAEIYDIVLTAQETAEATIESGMSGAAAHQIAHDVIAKAGYGERFGHGLGHGVGLEIHESPRVGKSSEDTLQDGMIITVEPGIYLPGWGGVRIEDMGIMEGGLFRPFTTAPKLRMVGN